LALMSARNPTHLNATGNYHFEMPYAIPSYLIALAVGDIGFKDLGTGCGVYAEKELLKSCAKEFEDLPQMMSVANELYGKYRWERYDVLVLPYSFPFGGMENPMLTFANPTLLTGDKSLVSVLAHELAHSWSGNLVTNHSWSDLWLNEGTTVYFEQRIMEALSGKEVADIMALIEFDELQDALKEIAASKNPEDSKLHLELAGRDPDLALSDVAYVKGAFFFKTLEQKVGRPALDQFLKGYFAHFAFQTIDAETFIAYLDANLLKPQNISFNYKQWIYDKGLPQNCLALKAPRLEQMKGFAKQFNAGGNPFKPTYRYKWIRKNGKRKKQKIDLTIRYQDRIIQEWQIFIRNLNTNTSVARMIQLDQSLHFSASQNSEVLKEWFVLAAQTSYALEIQKPLTDFLVKVGRRKYLMPIYEALHQNPKTKALAKQIFEKAKENYHSVSRSSVAAILK
jgi:leukotriene-A4 hydrolase